MASKSKAKGSAWERDVSKFLSETYDQPFMRVPQSGAYTGGQNAHRKMIMSDGQIRHMKGDIVPPDDWNHFNCECKNYVSFPFHHLFFDKPIPLLEEWFSQILEAADEGDVNVLFMKITRTGSYVAVMQPHNFEFNRFVSYTDKNGNEWTFTEFNSFFELNKEKFKKAHKK